MTWGIRGSGRYGLRIGHAMPAGYDLRIKRLSYAPLKERGIQTSMVLGTGGSGTLCSVHDSVNWRFVEAALLVVSTFFRLSTCD